MSARAQLPRVDAEDRRQGGGYPHSEGLSMASSLGRWRSRHLLLAWVAYWLVLLAAVARSPLIAVLRALSAPQGHGTMSLSMANAVLTLNVKTDGLSYTGSSSLTSIALWIAGPPLVLWVLWLVTRPSPIAARERTL
jgi:hypothetical protein